MRIGRLLTHLHELEARLAAELRLAAERHRDDHDVYHQCQTFALAADRRIERLQPHVQRHGGQAEWTTAIRAGSDDLLEDLRTLYLRAAEDAITWTMAAQAAKAARDKELLALATECAPELDVEAKWFITRIKTGAPQSFVVT